MARIIENNLIAASQYNPSLNKEQPFVICFNAEASSTRYGMDLGWERQVSNNLVVQMIEGANHFSILNNSDVVSVEVFNSLSCSTFFNTITMTVNPLPTPTLTATENSGTPNNNIICAGANVTFTATGGTNYNFKVNQFTENKVIGVVEDFIEPYWL